MSSSNVIGSQVPASRLTPAARMHMQPAASSTGSFSSTANFFNQAPQSAQQGRKSNTYMSMKKSNHIVQRNIQNSAVRPVISQRQTPQESYQRFQAIQMKAGEGFFNKSKQNLNQQAPFAKKGFRADPVPEPVVDTSAADSDKILADNLESVTKMKETKPLQSKSILANSVYNALWLPIDTISKQKRKPIGYLIGGFGSFWSPRLTQVPYEKEFKSWVKPQKLAYQPVKFLLFDNTLTRYLDKMWLNESTVDTSKVSGKEIYAQNEVDIQYLKSITDGNKITTAREKVLAAKNSASADWNDRSMVDVDKKAKVVVQEQDKEYTPQFITFIDQAVNTYDQYVFETKIQLNKAEGKYEYKGEGLNILKNDYQKQDYDDFNLDLFKTYVKNVLKENDMINGFDTNSTFVGVVVAKWISNHTASSLKLNEMNKKLSSEIASKQEVKQDANAEVKADIGGFATN